MRTYYPEIEPYATGMLDVGDGQSLYWEESGNPSGKPVVFLHGGPGGGTSPTQRRQFDPARYRILLFDQRGCGRSTPHVSEATTPDDLASNTTWTLVADLERLREARAIDRWQVFGGSWGAALGLAYAQTHPLRVTELVLRGIFTTRALELDWFYEGGASAIVPELWEKFVAPLPHDRTGSNIEAYHELLWHPDPAVSVPAAQAWSTWEAAAITLIPRDDLVASFGEERMALAFARIENHFFINKGWLEPDQLIRDAHLLRDIPGIIVHGRYDLAAPVVSAWDLHTVWPEAELRIIQDAGHSYEEPGILDALIEATDRFSR